MDIVGLLIDLIQLWGDTAERPSRMPPPPPAAEVCRAEAALQPEESRERFVRDCLRRATGKVSE